MKCFVLLAVVFSLLSIMIFQPIQAWDCHFVLTYIALENDPEIINLPNVHAETLQDFLKKEQQGLAKVLNENEVWSEKHIAFYPPLPKDLTFANKKNSYSLQTRFLYSLRMNPTLHLPLFLEYSPSIKHRIYNSVIHYDEVMLRKVAEAPWVHIPAPPLVRIKSDNSLSPLEIITSAVDEPDWGFDINLWEDNQTSFGKLYQLGTQPFGNKVSAFTSQAAFHMGFYYEKPITYRLAKFLRRCYPEYRIHLYLTLSKFAFQTHHPYWGYRFLGWALHYIQDLGQPYHSTVAPNVRISKIIIADIADYLGTHSLKQNIIQRLNNKHYAFENYEYFLLLDALKTNSPQNPFIQALQDQSIDKNYPAYDDSYPRQVIAKESHQQAKLLDKLVFQAFPKKYTTDKNYFFYITEPDVNVLKVVKQNPNLKVKQLDNELIALLRSVGAHTRNTINYVKEMSQSV